MRGPDHQPNLVHLGGFPSGGTDLLWSFVNSHPQVALAMEMPGLFRVVDEFETEIPGSQVDAFRARLRHLDVYNALRAADADLADLAARQRVRLAEIYYRLLAPGVGLVKGNKTPQVTENIAKVHRAFPDGRFIIIVRDVRDVCLSWRRKWGKDEVACAGRWNARMALALRAQAELGPETVLLLRFEDLLDHPEQAARRICDFLRLPFSENMLHHQDFVNSIAAGKRHFGAAIQADNKRKFLTALAEPVLRRIEECARPTMVQLGYQPVLAQSARPITGREMHLGRARDALAMVLVGNRYSQNNTLYWRLWQIAAMVRSRVA